MESGWVHNWSPRYTIEDLYKDPRGIHPHFTDFMREYRVLEKRCVWRLNACERLRKDHWEMYRNRADVGKRREHLRQCGGLFTKFIEDWGRINDIIEILRFRCPHHFTVLEEPLWEADVRFSGDFPEWFTYRVTRQSTLTPHNFVYIPQKFHYIQ